MQLPCTTGLINEQTAVTQMGTKLLLQLLQGCLERNTLRCFPNRCVPSKASRDEKEKKGACIRCGDALLPKALQLQLVPDHMTVDHGARDGELL